MKNIFVALLLCFSMLNAAFAATAPVNSVFNLGGFSAANVGPVSVLPASKVKNLVMIGAAASTGGTPGHYYSFTALNGASPGGGTQYRVPGTGTLTIYAIYVYDNAAASTVVNRQYGYGTATFSNDSATVPTGAVYYSAAVGAHYSPFNSPGGSENWQTLPFPITFPANSYPFYLASGSYSESIIMIGEVL